MLSILVNVYMPEFRFSFKN